ncbi:MAG: metal ABC transporter permease [Ktedonobacteraceae bacterium]|nr:metal ABC transporter permease [Ktedonobacteraceae bacterium]
MLGLFRYELVQNAFLAGTVVAIVAAVMGYFVVLRAQAFAGETLTDIGFAGASGAALFGIGPLFGMFVLTLLSAVGMSALGERIRGRDVEIGMVLSFALGLGVLFLSLTIQGASSTNVGIGILFGSILSVSRTDVLITLGTGIVALVAIALLFRPLLFSSVDPEVAQARGIPVRLLSLIFLLLLALTISEAVLVVGALLVSALLIVPAATAERLARSPLAAIGLSVVLGVAFTWIGLILAFVGTGGRHLPVSFYISALAALSYFLALIVTRLRAPRRFKPQPHPSRECRPVASHRS